MQLFKTESYWRRVEKEKKCKDRHTKVEHHVVSEQRQLLQPQAKEYQRYPADPRGQEEATLQVPVHTLISSFRTPEL